MDLDLNLLRVVVALHDARSVTGAAQQLGMGQPSVSTALGRLRRAFSDPLFVRTALGMQPTPRALALVGPARQALQVVDEQVLQSEGFDPASTQRQFTLASSDVGEMVFLPRLLQALADAAPGASIRMVSPGAHEVAQMMAAGTVDLALGYFPGLKGNNTYQQRLFSHGFVCVARRDHPIKGARMTLRQFTQARHAVVNGEGSALEVLEKFLVRHRITRQVVLDTPHFMTVPVIVSQSDLIATMPRALAEAFARMTQLRLIEPPFELPRYELKQHWHRRVHHEASHQWLRAQVAALFTDTTARLRNP